MRQHETVMQGRVPANQAALEGPLPQHADQGAISNARSSSRPRRSPVPSGGNILSMQNSARWVLPVTSTSRLRKRPSSIQGGHGGSEEALGNWLKESSSS